MLDPHLVPRQLHARAAHGSKLMFPPLHHADDPRFHNPILQHPLLASQGGPQATLDDEGVSACYTTTYPAVIQVPEHLLPRWEELEHDTLPMEQHPSYPLGNPYWIHHTPHTLQPAGSSQPKLDPRIYSRYAMRMHTTEQKHTLTAVAHGSAQAKAALEAQADEAELTLPYTVESDGHVVLAPHLQWRAQALTTTAPPTWPFRRFGPGPSARPYAALFRDAASAPDGQPEVSVWADVALEELVPASRPDSYTLPASLWHPYTHTAAKGRRRERPSGLPESLGAVTRLHDDAWLDEMALEADDVDTDDSFDRELASWAATESSSPSSSSSTQGPPRNSRRVSSAWMRDHHDFKRAILSVLADRVASTRQKRARGLTSTPEHAMSRKKRRSLPHTSFDSSSLLHDTASPSTSWVWGRSAPAP